MKTLIFLSTLITASQAQTMTWPIHGCAWVTETTSVTNFTLFRSASIEASPDYVDWNIPAYSIHCSTSSPSTDGKIKSIGKPGTITVVPCAPYKDESAAARLAISKDEGAGSNATVRFLYYAQCAASRYAVYYEVAFPLSCGEDEGKGVACVPKGNTTATATAQYHRLPTSVPPPPPRGGDVPTPGWSF